MGHIRIVIADDHPVVRAGLHEMLSSQPDFEIVGEASNGVEAVTLVNQVQPDVVLMDLRMTLLDGAAATEEILAGRPQTAVLVLTSYESNADILRAIGAGAMGYLLKDAQRRTLHRCAHRGSGKSGLCADRRHSPAPPGAETEQRSTQRPRVRGTDAGRAWGQ